MGSSSSNTNINPGNGKSAISPAFRDAKNSVKVATTANITLSGLQTIDGVSLVQFDEVLVKNQTDAKQNGIYIVKSGAWRLRKDFSKSKFVTMGAHTLVAQGTQAGQIWYIPDSDPLTLGVSNINFVQIVHTPAGSGEANTASNVGTGTGIFKQKTGVDLEFKSLKVSTDLTLTPSADELLLSAPNMFNVLADDTDSLAEGSSNLFNVTHTGEITGGSLLTVDPTAISNKALITAGSSMELLVNDGGALKKVVAGDFLNAFEVLSADKVGDVDGDAWIQKIGGANPLLFVNYGGTRFYVELTT